MSEFKSCARWPENCCPAIGNYSSDTHGSLAAAEGVLFRLRQDGFGGDRQFFPVETWVEEKVEDVWVRVSEDRAEKIRGAERSTGVIVGTDFSKVEERMFAFAAAAHKDGPALARAIGMSPALGAPYAGAIPDGYEYSKTETGRLSTSPQINLRLVNSDHPALHTRSREVREDEIPQLIAFCQRLRRFMREQGGCGLAANQLGDTRRWFVWEYGMVINPVLNTKSGDLSSMQEGCLSFPGKKVMVNRHKEIEVSYIDEFGNPRLRKLTGMPAIVFQHETDHLNGICIVDGKSGADIVTESRRRQNIGPALTSILATAVAMGAPMPDFMRPPPAPKEKTAEDLDRLEAARLKREAKEAKRQAQRQQTQKGN